MRTIIKSILKFTAVNTTGSRRHWLNNSLINLIKGKYWKKVLAKPGNNVEDGKASRDPRPCDEDGEAGTEGEWKMEQKLPEKGARCGGVHTNKPASEQRDRHIGDGHQFSLMIVGCRTVKGRGWKVKGALF